MKSGKVIGSEYVQSFRSYLATALSLPRNEDGSLSISAIAEASGIPRQSFYKNPQLKCLLDEVREDSVGRSSLDRPQISGGRREQSEGGSDDRAKVLERRLHKLEQLNAAVVAENTELRRQLKAMRLQLGREDMTIETGRRIPAPSLSHV